MQTLYLPGLHWKEEEEEHRPPQHLRTPQSAMTKGLQQSSETSRINQLPDDVLHLILSFLPTLAEIARTSILSRRWRNVWHNIDCLDFDASTVLSIEQLDNSQPWYIESVNKVIDARIARPGLPSVKDLRIRYKMYAIQGCHIDRWINFAIANRVETLHLEFSPYLGIVARHRQYILSEDSWRRAPSGLSNIKCLKSLYLSCVNVSKQFIEFILSSCPLLENLSLDFAGTYNDLDVSGVPPLRLKLLKIDALRESALAKLCAPYLTSFYYKSTKFNPQKIDVPMLTDLTVGGISGGPLHIMNYLEPFWSYLPMLEKLHLIVEECQELKFRQMPKFVKLKYLKICVDWDTDPVFHRIVKIINACPMLETFAFKIVDGDKISSRPLSIQQQGGIETRRQQRKVNRFGAFKSLKVLEMYGGDRKAIDQELVKCIISKAPNLEKLIIDTRDYCRYPFMIPSKPKIMEAVEAKAKELCSLETEIAIIG